ncbi:hypothetical protein [Phormidesmis priestleyi]|nr:hypothetical protein [Phormidesmis priestleyi]
MLTIIPQSFAKTGRYFVNLADFENYESFFSFVGDLAAIVSQKSHLK